MGNVSGGGSDGNIDKGLAGQDNLEPESSPGYQTRQRVKYLIGSQVFYDHFLKRHLGEKLGKELWNDILEFFADIELKNQDDLKEIEQTVEGASYEVMNQIPNFETGTGLISGNAVNTPIIFKAELFE